LDVIGLCLKLGRDDVGRLIGPQLLRSGTGVAANHRAAGHSRSRREFVSRLSVVIEEADESELWMDFLETLRFGPQEIVRRLRREAEELRSIFSASRRTAAAKSKQQRARQVTR
jgi:four helix bundle protein